MAENYFVNRLKGAVGLRVTEVRVLTEDEAQDMCWPYYDPEQAVVVIFDDGTAWIPMQDPEGNGPGFIEVASVIKAA